MVTTCHNIGNANTKPDERWPLGTIIICSMQHQKEPCAGRKKPPENQPVQAKSHPCSIIS